MTEQQTNIPKHHLETEMQIIHLMLRSRETINEILDSGISSELFDPCHQPLVDAIYREYITSDKKRLLTRESYRQFLIEQGMKGDMMIELNIFDKCFIKAFAKIDDLGYLKKRLIEGFVGRKCHFYIKEFRNDTKKIGFTGAAKGLVDKLQSALGTAEIHQTIFASLSEIKDDYLEDLNERITNPQAIIRCGIPEIDDAINVGFRPQHLTLVVADVGCYKTSLMLNVALSLFEKGYSVLFIPLEMDRYSLIDRIVCNKANINYNKLAIPSMLDDDEISRIKSAKFWLEEQNRFCILDVDEEISVSALKREIEKHAFAFKPRIVIIDYIAHLQPDVRYIGRNDLEIGKILKSLRFLGKKYGFHIISAAQMGRSAIKALREGKEDVVDSTSIHGSHQYSADSDTIFGLTKIKDEPDKIKLIVIKARHGPSGDIHELHVDPPYCRITSTKSMLISDKGTEDFESDINKPVDEIAGVVEKQNIDFVALNLDDDIAALGE